MQDLQAAAQAPAPESTPEISEEQALSEAFDRLTTEGVEEQPEEAPEQPAEGEEKPEAPEMPTGLPSSMKKAWAELSPEGREALQQNFQRLNAKMSEQGRIVQAVKPVQEKLMQAMQEIPAIQGMTPEQVAEDVFKMAQIQGQLAQDPVSTLLGIAQKYGALDGIRHALTGQGDQNNSQQSVQMAQEIRRLNAMLQQQMDPAALENRVMESLTRRETLQMVSEYASGQEHWGDVEGIIPQMIPIAQQRLGAGASAKDVLDQAYDMAIHAIPDLRAKAKPAAPAPAKPDPNRTAAQRKAKSVNVTSRTTGQARELSEEDALLAAYDRAASR